MKLAFHHPLAECDPSLFFRETGPMHSRVKMTWLGTAGFLIDHPEWTLVVDPFVTRPSLLSTALSPLVPDVSLIERYIPKANDVIVGHAHHDHLLDAPAVCLRHNARLIGSRDVCNVGRAAGMPESLLRETAGRESLRSGPMTVRGMPSRHGKVYFGRVPFPGSIDKLPRWPARVHELRHGLVLNWHIEVAGCSIVHIDSADFIDEELLGTTCDVLCLCAIGRAARPHYVRDAIALLKPQVVIPCHWDWFFSPLSSPARLLPGVDLQGFTREIQAAGAKPVVLAPLASFSM